MKIKIMSALLLFLTKSLIIADKGKIFYLNFKHKVKRHLRDIIPNVPDIGDSIFKSRYLMGVFYIAWYNEMLLKAKPIMV